MAQAKAGWTSFDITPPLGLPMGGRGPRFAAGTAVRDPLQGFLTLLEDADGHQLVLISLDLIGVGDETARAMQFAVSGVTGTPINSVLINCSHTHAGPMTHWSHARTLLVKSEGMLEYEQNLVMFVRRAAGEALQRLAPVTASWHEGTCDIAINRRKMVDGEAAMLPNPDGPYNPQMSVVRLQGDHGQAVLFNYGCHPVIVYSRDWTGISAEWPGKARQAIQQSLGAQTHAQYFQGFAGDVRPRILADLKENKFRDSIDGDEDQVGLEAAQSVLKALKDSGTELNLKLASVIGYANFTCEPGEPLEYWKTLIDDSDELTRNSARYWVKRLSNTTVRASYEPWPVGLVRLDDKHLMAWICGEPVSQWRDLLVQTLNTQHLMTMGYTNGILRGYLARDHHLPEGGYEVSRSRSGQGTLNPGLDKAMAAAFTGLLRDLDRP